MIDHNAFIGHWPFRNLGPAGTVAHFRGEMHHLGIEKAWVSSLDALFRQETQSANKRLLEEITGDPCFRFVPVIRPDAANAAREIEDLLQLANGTMEGIRVFPNFGSEHPNIEEWNDLSVIASHHRLPILLNVRMQDDRNQHPVFRVPAWSVSEVLRFAAQSACPRIILCGVHSSEIRKHSAEIRQLTHLDIEISGLDGALTFDWLKEYFGKTRLVFGSNYPVFTTLAAVLKSKFADLGKPNHQNLS